MAKTLIEFKFVVMHFLPSLAFNPVDYGEFNPPFHPVVGRPLTNEEETQNPAWAHSVEKVKEHLGNFGGTISHFSPTSTKRNAFYLPSEFNVKKCIQALF